LGWIYLKSQNIMTKQVFYSDVLNFSFCFS
jgi:hypothetical protein